MIWITGWTDDDVTAAYLAATSSTVGSCQVNAQSWEDVWAYVNDVAEIVSHECGKPIDRIYAGTAAHEFLKLADADGWDVSRVENGLSPEQLILSANIAPSCSARVRLLGLA